MIYAAFSVYLVGILFAAMGVYRLWAGMLNPRWINWALLPGTLVSEMAYIFGCLITGGEVRRARLMGAGEGAPRRGKPPAGAAQAEPTTEAAPRLAYVGPIVAAFMSLLACGACLVVAHRLLGETVIESFAAGGDTLRLAERLKSLPTRGGEFWDQLKHQVDLLHRMGATWLELDWLNWRVPLFVYLAGCLTIRLCPVRRSLRASLAAVVLGAGLIALVGTLWRRFDGLMDDLWPLVTYLWASVLFLLSLSLLARGLVGLVRALLEKERQPGRSAGP